MRAKNLKPHLVRIVGSAGEPDWGLRLGAARRGQVAVVIVRRFSHTPPRRLTVPVTWVTPAPVLTAPQGVLENLVRCGALTGDEYAAWMKLRLTARIEAEEWLRPCPTRRKRVSPWHNIGKGEITKEARRFIR